MALLSVSLSLGRRRRRRSLFIPRHFFPSSFLFPHVKKPSYASFTPISRIRRRQTQLARNKWFNRLSPLPGLECGSFFIFYGKIWFYSLQERLLVCKQTLWHFGEHFSGKKNGWQICSAVRAKWCHATSEKHRACTRQKIFLRGPYTLGKCPFPRKRKEEEKEISSQSSFEKKVKEKGSAGLNAKRRKFPQILCKKICENFCPRFFTLFSNVFKLFF